MGKYDVSQSSTTDVESVWDAYTPDTAQLDAAGDIEETTYTFDNAARNIGYYKNIPELKKAVDGLAMWTVGKGWMSNVPNHKLILDSLRGCGFDNFQSIMENMIVMKKVIGDAFAEIIRNDKDRIINLKPISGERMRLVFDKKGQIKRYEVYTKVGRKHTVQKFQPNDILHLSNDRVGDEIHGVSVVDACKWVIDARNEAMTDYRTMLHRNVIPVRLIEIDTDDTTKRNALITQYQNAIKDGEVLVIPKGTVEFKDIKANFEDPLNWVRYLENFFYQAVGIPKIILGGSEEFTEATSKVSYLTFEQVYMREQRLLEKDIENQLQLKVEFERPASMQSSMADSEAKNTGQVGFQPKDTTPTMTRE